METAAGIVQEAANPEANIIFGATWDESFEDQIRVTVIATGFEQKPAAAEAEGTSEKAVKAADDIEDIFSIFNR